MIKLDINSDVGEGADNESQLMPYISSCNIACGGHAGTQESMEEMLAFAKAYSIKIGAHPSYPDKENFGRVVMDISDSDLRKSIISQVKTLKNLAEKNDLQLHHIKPHGALYNLAAKDENIANIIVDSVLAIDDHLSLYVPYKSVLQEVASQKLKTIVEGFADRKYLSDYSLMSRNQEGAVIIESNDVIQQVLGIAQHQKIKVNTGEFLPFNAETVCIHSDTKNAITIAKDLHNELIEAGIQVGL